MTPPLTPEDRARLRERYKPLSLLADRHVLRLLDAYEALEKREVELMEAARGARRLCDALLAAGLIREDA